MKLSDWQSFNFHFPLKPSHRHFVHRFRSKRALLKLRLGSFFFLLFVISLVLLTPAIVWGTLLGHKEDLLYAAILLTSSVVTGVLYLLIGAGVRCPLCHGTVIGRNGSSRSRKGSRTFGSYRLGVALRVLTVGHYRCPYCGEPTKCQNH